MPNYITHNVRVYRLGISCSPLLIFLVLHQISLSSSDLACDGFLNYKDAETLEISPKNASQKIGATGDVIVQNVKVLEPLSTAILNISDIGQDVHFIVTEVHSHLHNVTLGYHPVKLPHSFVTGTNIGLVNMTGSAKGVKLYLENVFTFEIIVMISIIGYDKLAPIPGGCNMEFDVPTAPYLQLTLTENAIYVDSQPAAESFIFASHACIAPLQYETYHMYMPERDFTIETYFDSIRKMLTVDEIEKNGRKVAPSLIGTIMRRIYSAYTGTGSVYALVTSDGHLAKAAYVPSQSYACTLGSFSQCRLFTTDTSQLAFAVSFCVGLFLCFFGHEYFKVEMFVTCLLSFGTISYIVLSHSFPIPVSSSLSILSGAAFGGVWLYIWVIFGIPVISALVPLLSFGYLCTATSFYFIDIKQFQQVEEIDINYWLAFLCSSLSIALLMLTMTRKASMMASALVGSYLVIFPFDNYFGSNLKFIFINPMRRALVDGFSSAVTAPPFQHYDFLLTAVWFGLFACGYVVQLISSLGKPPFPHPRRNNLFSNATTERTPLLNHGNFARVFGSPGSDNVFVE